MNSIKLTITINSLMIFFLFVNSSVVPYRGRLFKESKFTLLFSDEKGGICCGKEMKPGKNTFDLSRCDNGIVCEGVLVQEFSENTCKRGFPYNTVCGVLNFSGVSENCIHKRECLCDPVSKMYFCDSVSGVLPNNTNCERTLRFKMNRNNELVKDLDGNILLGFIDINICVVKTGVKLVSYFITGDILNVNLESSDQNSCDIIIGSKTCTYICDKNCILKCKLPEEMSALTKGKVRATIRCDNWSEKIWLFRDNEKYIHSGLHSHNKWTNVRSDIAELLYFDILFGYFTITFIVYAVVFIYNNSSSIGFYTQNLLRKLFKSDMDAENGYCDFCQCKLISLEDAYLHGESCPSVVCPYCNISVEFSISHVQSCRKKLSALEGISSMIDDIEKKDGLKLKQKFKENVLSKLVSYNSATYKLWLSSVFLLTFLCLIIPTSGLLEQPCSKTLGETANCQNNLMKAIKGKPSDHHHWTALELGMYEKIEHKLLGSSYQMNRVARLKLDSRMFEGVEDPETMIGTVSDCNNKNNECRFKSRIEWTGSLCEYSSSAFRTSDSNIYDNTLHLVIMGIEYKILLEHMYDTGYFRINSHDVFTCTGKCDLCNTKNRCVKKVFKKESDTSWTHNPVDCLSVNSGCTCSLIEILVDYNKPVFSVYKTIKKEMSAVFCMEYNNIFIECELIKDINSYRLGSNILHVDSWTPDIEIPETIVVKHDSPGNSFIKTAYIGNVCKRNSCRMGEFGDIQFNRGHKSCNESIFMNVDDIKGELIYNFGRTPRWNVEIPECGASNFETFTPLSNMNGFVDHLVNLSDNTLVIDGGCVGKFSLKLEINDVIVHKLEELAKITRFDVNYCSGEYGSLLGAVCTFTVEMKGTPKATISILSDSTLIMQDDSQLIEEGINVFRKFMYVRGLHPSYKFCYKFHETSDCSSIKNNFTAPSENFRVKPDQTFSSPKIKRISTCNDNYSPYCIYARFLDLFKGLTTILYIILTILVLYIVLSLSFKRLKSCWFKEYRGVIDGQALLSEKIRKLKKSGFRRKYI